MLFSRMALTSRSRVKVHVKRLMTVNSTSTEVTLMIGSEDMCFKLCPVELNPDSTLSDHESCFDRPTSFWNPL